jgi:hypothetical protein
MSKFSFIKSITLKDIPENIIFQGKKGRLIFRDNALYFGGFVDDKLISLISLIIHKNKNAVIKTNFTLEGYRGQGFFTELNKYCLDYAWAQGVKIITLNCLKDSLNIHLKQGARVWKTTKTIYWMIYDKI